jgi:phospho-N-acetylmuramoyl-pentapeptide-transferase
MPREIITLFTFNIIKILLLSSLAAIIAFLISPFLVRFLNKIKFWKKNARQKTITGDTAEVVYSLHKEREVGIPRGGGMLIWLTVLILIFLFFGLSFIKNPWWLKMFNFLSRAETWLPFFTLISASLIGLLDDILVVFGKIPGKFYQKMMAGKEYIAGGLSFTARLFIVALIGFIGGWWFYFKLGWDSIHIPLLFNFPYGIDVTIGVWIIPLFILVMVASWAGGVIDGLDGLAGGIFASIFGAFTIIAFSQGKIDLATFCAVIFGTLFAFLWFNIPPARFYMGETGILGLTSTMAVVAFFTDSVAILPIIAGPLVIEVGSIILQLISKKIRGKKIWLATPIHHHFEAKGMPVYQIVMRFWIIGVVLAIFGVAIRLLG